MKKKEIGIYTLIIMVTIIFSILIFNEEKESRIKRIIEKSEIKPGEIIRVTLDVSIKGEETYYAAEEYLPLGWTIIEDGGGSTADPNRLAWVVIQDAENTKYTYTIKAPDREEEYIASGIYMFEGDTTPITTKGDSEIKVIS